MKMAVLEVDLSPTNLLVVSKEMSFIVAEMNSVNNTEPVVLYLGVVPAQSI